LLVGERKRGGRRSHYLKDADLKKDRALNLSHKKREGGKKKKRDP